MRIFGITIWPFPAKRWFGLGYVLGYVMAGVGCILVILYRDNGKRGVVEINGGENFHH